MKVVAGTIEICSIHPGPLTYCRKDGEVCQVVLNPTGEQRNGKAVYAGLVDNEIAITYLDKIGLPHYWKPGAVVVEGEKFEPIASTNHSPVSIETIIALKNFAQFKAAVKECTDLQGLEGIAAALPEGGKKKEVAARIEELTKAAVVTLDAASYSQFENAEDLKTVECNDPATLMQLIAAETQDKNRQEFIDVLQARLDALNAG